MHLKLITFFQLIFFSEQIEELPCIEKKYLQSKDAN